MKDFSKEQLRDSRPSISPIEGISFCLEQIYNDNDKTLSDTVVEGLTFEELIGALLLAEDSLKTGL